MNEGMWILGWLVGYAFIGVVLVASHALDRSIRREFGDPSEQPEPPKAKLPVARVVKR